MFKVNNKDTQAKVLYVALVSLLLTLNIFHIVLVFLFSILNK